MFPFDYEEAPEATPWVRARVRKSKDERADVTTDGQVSLSNGTLQPKRTLQRACAQTGRTSTLTWPHLTHQFARAVLDISVLQADELPAQAESIGA